MENTYTKQTLNEERKLRCLASCWTHMDYAYVHMNFIIILQFSYFMIQYVYVCKDGLPMYVFMYLFLQYLHHGL